MADTELFSVDTTIVKMVSDTGLVGWGEACPLGPTYQPEHSLGIVAVLAQMAPKLIGESTLTPTLFRRTMDGLLNGHHSAKAALDIAGLDLTAKYYGVRVCDLLGGAATDRVPSYYALGLGEPDEVARLAKQKFDQGFRRLQLKIGGREIEKVIEVIRKVWETVGTKVRIVADTNRSLTTRDTIQMSLQCTDIPLVMEQPCNTIEENAVSVNAVLAVISNKICDGFGLKVTRLGGLTTFATVRDVCEARSMPITCDDTFGGDIIAAACVHGGATVAPELLNGVWIATPYIAESYDSENGLNILNGKIELPTGPGLGVLPDEQKIGSRVASFG